MIIMRLKGQIKSETAIPWNLANVSEYGYIKIFTYTDIITAMH